MPLHSLELMMDQHSDAWVRREWQALLDAGLPSQATHRGTTNAPHITVAAAPCIDATAETAAVGAIAPLLPRPVELAGVVLLGKGPYALARLLAPDVALEAAVRRVRSRVDDPHPAAWLAHLTLARRMPMDKVGQALSVLTTGVQIRRQITVTGLRRWDPDAGITRLLAGAYP